MARLVKLQLGKHGLTEAFLKQLQDAYKANEFIKINLLKSCTRNRQEKEKIKEKVLKALEQVKIKNKRAKIRLIGYTLIIRKVRRGKKNS